MIAANVDIQRMMTREPIPRLMAKHGKRGNIFFKEIYAYFYELY
jgi:hypothetical protein